VTDDGKGDVEKEEGEEEVPVVAAAAAAANQLPVARYPLC
jgi:hypothetical protein